jgi:hypothetical protein
VIENDRDQGTQTTETKVVTFGLHTLMSIFMTGKVSEVGPPCTPQIFEMHADVLSSPISRYAPFLPEKHSSSSEGTDTVLFCRDSSNHGV